MSKTRLNAEEAFKSIMGKTDAPNQDTPNPAAGEPVIPQKTKENQTKEKLIQTAFYITGKQHKALKIKAALGGKPEDKDRSAIVRAALDIYLADILEK